MWVCFCFFILFRNIGKKCLILFFLYYCVVCMFLDINECELNIMCDYYCVNILGSYYCNCVGNGIGYIGKRKFKVLFLIFVFF